MGLVFHACRNMEALRGYGDPSPPGPVGLTGSCFALVPLAGMMGVTCLGVQHHCHLGSPS